jgi:two-component system response regulator ChvI
MTFITSVNGDLRALSTFPQVLSHRASSSTPLRAADATTEPRLVLIDQDPHFREAVRLSLLDQNVEVIEFESGEASVDHFAGGGQADVILLDWQMRNPSALDAIRRLRDIGVTAPIAVVSTSDAETSESAALAAGAIDFISKPRGLSILTKRLVLILRRTRASADHRRQTEALVCGPLLLKLGTSRALWHDRQVDLTLTRFNIVHLLVSRIGQPVSYREIYDVVHRHGFIAGNGIDGYRANVRTLIKRIRQNFRDIDGNFDAIRNLSSLGYRWQEGTAEAAALPPVG